MERNFIDVPLYTTFKDIINKDFSLSATQYKSLCINNKNQIPLKDFLDRELLRKDRGKDVGTEAYVDNSPYKFIKTKALQPKSYLLDVIKDSVLYVIPDSFVSMHLQKGDLIISKDANVGEVIILDKDLPNAMLCGSLYKLPVTKHKYYLLAVIKSDLFRQQIDFLVPRGSTIRHGKTKFLECMIPIPEKNKEETMEYVETLTQAIINKEIEIKHKHNLILEKIQEELENNQNNCKFVYSLPSLKDIQELERMDSSVYSYEFKEKEFLIKNYKNGISTIYDLDFNIVRGQNLQVSAIGKSVQTSNYINGYYQLITPTYITKYGTIAAKQYLGNPNKLKTIKYGELIFGAEGNGKGRSLVFFDKHIEAVTNIHGITLSHNSHNLQKTIFVKLFLDYYRAKGMIDAYAVGGNGGSLAIKYWKYLFFPNFPEKLERELVRLYYTPNEVYNPSDCNLTNFMDYDNDYNKKAGIYDLDASMNYLKTKLENTLSKIIDNKKVEIKY